MSVACYQHSKCSVVRLIEKLPFGATSLCTNYLIAGRRLKGRDQGPQHMAMFLCSSYQSFRSIRVLAIYIYILYIYILCMKTSIT